jgi:hypothetical protein
MPSEAGISLPAYTGRKGLVMASHECWTVTLVASPARKRILKQFRQIHFGQSKLSDADLVAFMAQLAFTVPKHLSAACDFAVRYHDAEGHVDGVEQITGTVAATWGKFKA